MTGSATVTRFDALDRSRNDEVERAVVRLLDDCGIERYHRHAADGDPRVSWRQLRAALDDSDLPAGIAGDLAKLAERHSRAFPSLATIGLDVAAEFEYVAGQYLALTYRGTPRPYSIASSPNDEETELCIRRVPNGRLTGDLFQHLAVGDEVTVRGPAGEFVLGEPSHRDLVFLATGTGVAPLKSMIEYTLETGRDVHEGRQRDVWLFLGTSWADDLPYRERFEALAAERDNVHFVPCCTREPLLSEWPGETDYVQQVLVKHLAEDVPSADLPESLRRFHGVEPSSGVDARLHPDRMEVYACGINAMVHQLETAVRDVGVPARHVDAEGYG